MKKIVKLFAVGLLVAGLSKAASAATFANIQLDVTVSSDIEVTLVNASSVAALGSIALNSSTATTTGMTVRNTSNGINVTYSLYSYDSTPWTLAASTGSANVFALRALVSPTQPALSAYHDTFDVVVTTTIAGSASGTLATTSTGNGKFESGVAANQNGVNVPTAAASGNAAAERTLWFKFISPSSVTGGLGGRSITVTVLGNMAS